MIKPAYKLEIEQSGLTQKKWYAKVYLRSEHWSILRSAKFREVGRKCEICGETESIEVHHIRYRDIYDVRTSDLQVLCSAHHAEEHGLKKKQKQKSKKKKAKNNSILNEHPDSIPSSYHDFRAKIDPLYPFESAQQALPKVPIKDRNRTINLLVKELRQTLGKKGNQKMLMRLRSLKNGKTAKSYRLILGIGPTNSVTKPIDRHGSKPDSKWNANKFNFEWNEWIKSRPKIIDTVESFRNCYGINLRARHQRFLDGVSLVWKRPCIPTE